MQPSAAAAVVEEDAGMFGDSGYRCHFAAPDTQITLMSA